MTDNLTKAATNFAPLGNEQDIRRAIVRRLDTNHDRTIDVAEQLAFVNDAIKMGKQAAPKIPAHHFETGAYRNLEAITGPELQKGLLKGLSEVTQGSGVKVEKMGDEQAELLASVVRGAAKDAKNGPHAKEQTMIHKSTPAFPGLTPEQLERMEPMLLTKHSNTRQLGQPITAKHEVDMLDTIGHGLSNAGHQLKQAVDKAFKR